MPTWKNYPLCSVLTANSMPAWMWAVPCVTLEWAMRQSNAEAGLIGILEEQGIRLMAQQGYGEVEQTYKDALIPLNQKAMLAAVETRHLNAVLWMTWPQVCSPALKPRRLFLSAGKRM